MQRWVNGRRPKPGLRLVDSRNLLTWGWDAGYGVAPMTVVVASSGSYHSCASIPCHVCGAGYVGWPTGIETYPPNYTISVAHCEGCRCAEKRGQNERVNRERPPM